MKFKVFIVFVFFACSLLAGISLAQNKVVIIPLISDSGGEIPTVTSAGGRVWMDRNLGAVRVAERFNDYQAFGWLYQWGRLADGHEDRGSDTTTSISSGNVPGHDNFITPNPSSLFDWRSPQNNNLWQPGTGINNPCPDSFRLPTETEWATERASWLSDESAGAFASPLKLVVAGIRNQDDGTISSAGVYGFYWSSSIFNAGDGFLSYVLSFSDNSASVYATLRGFGGSVRCIKD